MIILKRSSVSFIGTLLMSLIPQASFAESMQCVGSSYVGGIDVSSYDYDTQFGEARTSGHYFAAIKVSEGITIIDPKFARNWKDAQIAGVVRAPYHFFHPSDDATTQVNNFLGAIGQLQSGDLPPILDLEVTDGQSNADVIAGIKSWLTQVESATGVTPILYTDGGFWEDLGSPSGFEHYPLFIADWGVDCAIVPHPWSSWTFWQKSSTGTVVGVGEGTVDLDLFNGSLSELRAMTVK